MFLGLRKTGITKNISMIAIKTIESVYGDVLRELEQEGLLVNEEDRVYLTPRGTFWGTMCLSAFV